MILINLVKSGALVITGLVAARTADMFLKKKALEKKIRDYIKYPVDLTRIKKECAGVKRELNPIFKLPKWQRNRILKEKQLYELFLAYGPFVYKYGGLAMMHESIKRFDAVLNMYKPVELIPRRRLLRVSFTDNINKEWIKKGQFGPYAYSKVKSQENRPISCK